MKMICAVLVFFQQVFVTSVPALMIAVPASTLLSGCGSPGERADTRQDTRVQERTDDRYDRRRGGSD
jgi:hypothetical protein